MAITPQGQMTKAVVGRIRLSFPGRFDGDLARDNAKDIVEKAFEWQINAGTTSLPKKAAKLVLTESLPFLPKGYLQYLEAEGVTVEDIKSWWNQPDIFRWMDVAFDEWRLNVYFIIYFEACRDLDEAWSEVYRKQPCFVYGPPVEHERLKGDDRPLPYELNHRYDVFLRRTLLKHGRESLWAEATEYRTMNRLFRAKIHSSEA
jgi:hypothetical protein